jgi:hypothetical protein
MLCQSTPRPHSSLKVENESATAGLVLVSRIAFFERVCGLHGINIYEGQQFKVTHAVTDTPPLALGLLLPNAETLVYLKHGTPAQLGDKLTAFLHERAEPDAVAAMRISRQLWSSFSFPQQLLQADYGSTSACVERDGDIISSCISCRENAFMAEAFVRTMPSYRGCGYGARVTLAWAREVHRGGRTPVFSCRGDNLGSLGIASRLGLTLQFRELRLMAET